MAVVYMCNFEFGGFICCKSQEFHKECFETWVLQIETTFCEYSSIGLLGRIAMIA